jgi:hypothetical protein
MSSWGNYDAASNVPYWSAASVKLAPTAVNAAALYQDTTANDFITGATVGVFAVDDPEGIVNAKAAHAGWVLRTTGSGGRAGRIQQETLAVISKFKSDNNTDDTVYPDAVITISQPATLRSVVANTSAANVVTYSVSGTTVTPSSATLTYQWQVNNNAGGTWVNIDNGTDVSTGQPGGSHKTGANTASLSIAPTDTTANNYVFRCVITATNAGITNSSATAYSANGRILIS